MAKDKGKPAAKSAAADDDTGKEAADELSHAIDCVTEDMQDTVKNGTAGAEMKAAGFNPIDFLPVVIAFMEWWKKFRSER